MAFTIYRSTDGSAPSLDGTVGSLVNLLDKCLVAGYGAKSAAGWTKPYTGANKASFRSGAGTQFYARVQDDAPGAGGAKEARIRGYETMSDVDTGTGDFPTVAGLAAGNIVRKSTSADATARTWIIVADSRTCYGFVLTGDVASSYYSFAIGDFYSMVPADAYNCLCIGRATENSGTGAQERLSHLTGSLAALSNHYFARGHTGLGGAVQFSKHGDFLKTNSVLNTFAGAIPFTNPADGGLYLSRIWITDPTTAPTNGIRGRMRGIWQPLHPDGSFADGDTFSGTGDLAGKTFLAIRKCSDSSGAFGTIVIETSDTLETN